MLPEPPPPNHSRCPLDVHASGRGRHGQRPTNIPLGLLNPGHPSEFHADVPEGGRPSTLRVCCVMHNVLPVSVQKTQ